MNEVSDSNKYILGRIAYVDPQHFRKQKANKKSDVYSVGVLLWEISSGKKPFESHDNFPDATLMSTILSGKREIPIPDTPDDYIDIYESMVLITIILNYFVLFVLILQTILAFFHRVLARKSE